jgi:hypothetical protein
MAKLSFAHLVPKRGAEVALSATTRDKLGIGRQPSLARLVFNFSELSSVPKDEGEAQLRIL